MEKFDWFLQAMGNVQQGINAEYMPIVRDFIVTRQINGQILNSCQMASSEAPAPMTVAVLAERAAYTNEAAMEQGLKMAEEAGYLTAVSEGAYQLTDPGNALASEILQAINTAAKEVTPLSEEEMARLAGYIHRLRTACQNADTTFKACLKRSMSFDQGDASPLAEKIRRGLNDLAAFRDDAHLASWANLDVTGPGWDAFSHIWGEKVYGDPVNTAEQIAQKMSFHGFSAEDYAQHLQPLVDRGWLTLTNDSYAITEAGQAVRWQAERDTDQLFYQGWDLSDEEIADMKSLMQDLVTAVAPPDNNELYDQALNLRAKIGALYGQKLQTKIQDANLPNWGLLLLMVAQSNAPKAMSVDTILAQIPYMNPDTLTAHIQETADAGFLAPNGSGYHINDSGKSTVSSILDSVSNWVDQDVSMDTGQLEAMYQTLNQMSQGFQNSQEPETKPALDSAQFFSPEEDAPILLRISRTIAEIAAFRDDAHVAAFSKYEVPAYEWEAFSHVWGENIWGDQVNTAVDVSQKLGFRGYSEEAYAKALEAAVKRGWLSKNDKNVYALTDKGRDIREEAEQETNRLFFTPWQFFAPRELNELSKGIERLNKAL